MKIAIYTRVSTLEQKEHGYSLGEQSERLEGYAKARGWSVYKVYTDGGHSGASLDRPALKSMIRDIERGKVDGVLVYKLDRLSRSQKDTLYLIEDVFNRHGVGFVSMQESFDTSTPFGKAMVGILSVFAQLEREQIKERMTLGKIGRAKTKASRRTISLDKKTLDMLSQWQLTQRKEMLRLGYNTNQPDQYIFTNNDNRHLNKYYVATNLKRLIKKYKLPPLTPHGLRHTHCSLLFEAGASIKEVQDRLGHSNVQATMNIYAHVTKNKKEETADKFAKFMEI